MPIKLIFKTNRQREADRRSEREKVGREGGGERELLN